MPGETLETLKSKATKQAKKSGMSQAAAEKYGSARAAQSAIQGQGGTSDEFGFVPSIVSDSPELLNAYVQNQIAARKEAEKKMQEAGGVYNPQTGEVEYPPKKEGIFNFSGFKMPTLPTGVGMGVEFLKGVQSTDRFFKNLATKGVDGLTPEDNIILANLIAANKKNPNVFGDLSKYTTDDVDVEELGKRLQDAVRPLENTNYESLVNSYLSNKPTGIDSLTTMGSDLSNLFGDPRLSDLLREDGSYTLEGLQNKQVLGPQGLAYLKANDPKTYYSFTQPQTSGGLEELAQFDLSTLGSSPKDRQLAARVVAAREATSGQGGGGGAGIPSLATAPTPFTDVNNNGILDNLEVAQATTTPVTGPASIITPTLGVPNLTPTTIDYASMGPQYGGYVNQGISDPRFASYLQNLQMFPRRS